MSKLFRMMIPLFLLAILFGYQMASSLEWALFVFDLASG